MPAWLLPNQSRTRRGLSKDSGQNLTQRHCHSRSARLSRENRRIDFEHTDHTSRSGRVACPRQPWKNKPVHGTLPLVGDWAKTERKSGGKPPFLTFRFLLARRRIALVQLSSPVLVFSSQSEFNRDIEGR